MSLLRAFPQVCIALGFRDPAKLIQHAEDELAAGEVFFEFRLDYLERPLEGVKALKKFMAEHPECSVLATCRRRQNHGQFTGSLEEQLTILQAAADAGAKALDMEIESAEAVGTGAEVLRRVAPLVVSYHNFEGTPALTTVLRRLEKVPADAYKIVTTARKPSDNFRVLSLGQIPSRVPLILLAMGEIGFPTRVLSLLFGGLFTYAAPRTAEGTAAGQVSAKQLRQLYRVGKLTRSAKIYGVIADPVRHSISPAVLNRAFQARRINAVYLPFRVPPAYLRDFMEMADKLPVTGFSVTIPHKQKILRYLDVVEPLARRIGAVNTVWRKAGKWRGANADVAGVMRPLERYLRVAKSTVLIAGNGGAARSAAFALAEAGAKVFIVGRNPDRVRALARACGATPLNREELGSCYFDVLIHATPLGMYPRVNECFFGGQIPADVVFDMVYNPVETLLIRRAREQGKTVLPGIQMFLEQAARQFEIWSGESAPRTAMERAAWEALTSYVQTQEESDKRFETEVITPA
jgi:3-dehydroquinate dehydratase/shikimate dehydrogenase